jgi:hypothetical protein
MGAGYANKRKAIDPGKADDRDIFETANLYPETTGLPMTVWVSPRGMARDVRVKVNMTRGNQVNIANTAVVGVRPKPRVMTGRLWPAAQRKRGLAAQPARR